MIATAIVLAAATGLVLVTPTGVAPVVPSPGSVLLQNELGASGGACSGDWAALYGMRPVERPFQVVTQIQSDCSIKVWWKNDADTLNTAPTTTGTWESVATGSLCAPTVGCTSTTLSGTFSFSPPYNLNTPIAGPYAPSVWGIAPDDDWVADPVPSAQNRGTTYAEVEQRWRDGFDRYYLGTYFDISNGNTVPVCYEVGTDTTYNDQLPCIYRGVTTDWPTTWTSTYLGQAAAGQSLTVAVPDL